METQQAVEIMFKSREAGLSPCKDGEMESQETRCERGRRGGKVLLCSKLEKSCRSLQATELWRRIGWMLLIARYSSRLF